MGINDEFKQLFALENLDKGLYRNKLHRENFSGTLFGGQILGQALYAAADTVEGRQVHSMHANFLRAGTSKRPVIYEVDFIRDGSSFSVRRVVALQNGSAIFSASISFHVEEQGFSHQAPPIAMLPVPTEEEIQAAAERIAAGAKRFSNANHTHVSPPQGLLHFVRAEGNEASKAANAYCYWVKAIHPLDSAQLLQSAALAYASDLGLMGAGINSHGIEEMSGKIMGASLDHSIWFHQDVDINDWLLYETQSPWTGGARGLNFGRFLTRDGRCVATTTQEALMRPIDHSRH